MSFTSVLARSPLPPPSVQWWGGEAARALASAGAGDSAASSLLREGVAGSSHSQEALVLTDPFSVASSRSPGGDRHTLEREEAPPMSAPAHSLHAYLPLGVELPVKARSQSRGVRALSRESCSRSKVRSWSRGRKRSRSDSSRSPSARVRSRHSWSQSSHTGSSEHSQSEKWSWRSGRRRWDREEAVGASCDRGNSGLTEEPAPAVAGGSSDLPLSSFPDLVRLFLGLSGSVDQRGAVLGSLLSAAGVTGAGGVSAPAAPVTSAAPVACSSAVPAPGVLTPAGAASATASPGRCERACESSCPERRERSRSGGKHGGGQSPSPACSARLASASASSSSESSASEVRVSVMPLPPSSRPGAGGGRFGSDRSASGRARSPQPGPSGLGSGERAALRADRSCSAFYSRSSPAPSDAVENDRDSVSGTVDLDQDDSFRAVLCLIREFHGMEEPASVVPNRCKTSLAPIYRLQSESSRLFTCLFPTCLVLSLRTQIWLWPSLWKIRPSMGFSLFPFVAIGGTTGPPPPLFLACTPSRPVWPRSPETR